MVQATSARCQHMGDGAAPRCSPLGPPLRRPRQSRKDARARDGSTDSRALSWHRDKQLLCAHQLMRTLKKGQIQCLRALPPQIKRPRASQPAAAHEDSAVIAMTTGIKVLDWTQLPLGSSEASTDSMLRCSRNSLTL